MALVALRAGLAPAVVLLAWLRPAPPAFAACLIAALLSDVFDGMLARRLGVATPRLRRLDSIVDTVFYLGVLVAIMLTVPHLLRPYWLALAALCALELARHAYDLRKFGREASYHMWSSKLWGLLLFAGAFSALVFRTGGWPLALAIGWGIVADLEGLAISMTLTHWRTDVATLWHARLLAKNDA